MSSGASIHSVKELLAFFEQTQQKIFVVGRIYSNTPLDIYRFIPSFQMITCYDPFNGEFPFITVPDHLRNHKCNDPFQCQLSILRNPETMAYIKSRSLNPRILYMMIDEENQKISQDNGLSVWCGPCAAFNELGNKIKILEMIKKIGGIPFIPNVCSKINSYKHLRQLSQPFKTDKLVVQSENGCSGMTTYFIFSEEDYNKYEHQLTDIYVKKIMPFKRVKSFGISAVAGKFGTVIGPLHAEVIGHKKLTPYRGGFCANQMRSDYFENPEIEKKIRREIFQITKKLGDHLYKQKLFKGIFGVDFVVDYDTHEVYFMQINPRLTGSTTISFQTYQAEGIQFPIVLFHFAQYLNLNLQLPIEEYNRSWEELTFYQSATHIAIKPFTEAEKNINYTGFPPGLWTKNNNSYEFTDKFTLMLREMSEDEILFIPNHGFSKGNILMKKKCQQFSGQLTQETEEIIDFFLGKMEKYKKSS